MRLFTLLFGAAVTLSAGTNSIYAQGKTLYFQNGCNNCHGGRGEGSGNYPFLATRAKGFLTYKLRTFRKGVAENARQEMMTGFAMGLSDADIDAITTFLSDFHDEQTEKYDMEFQTWGDGGS